MFLLYWNNYLGASSDICSWLSIQVLLRFGEAEHDFGERLVQVDVIEDFDPEAEDQLLVYIQCESLPTISQDASLVQASPANISLAVLAS
jgi:hypothetical protein